MKISLGFGFTPIQYLKYKLSRKYRRKVDNWVDNALKEKDKK